MDNNMDKMFEALVQTPFGESVKKVYIIFSDIQQTLYGVELREDRPELLRQKIGTILVFSVIEKVQSGITIKHFTKEDWMAVANDISEYAVVMEGQKYSAFVFLQYANYIEASADHPFFRFSEKEKESFEQLVAGIRRKTEQFEKSEVDEIAYTESCLWICLEAMIKLIAASSKRLIGEEASQLVEAISMCAFEYGRYIVYAKENQQIADYLERQAQLDDKLAEEYDQYRKEIEKQSKDFLALFEHAFDSDFRTRLMCSADIAKYAGVEEEEILDSIDAIDDFFA